MAIIEMTRDELAHCPTVEFTETWSPVRHQDVVNSLHKGLKEAGSSIVKERYEVSRDGLDMFGSWTLPADGAIAVRDQMSIGFRNSMKKRFSLGVVAGNNVMVCSNMCFWGDYAEHRRHTSGLDEEALLEFAIRAVAYALHGAAEFRAWFEDLGNQPLQPADKKAMVYDAMDAKIIAPSQFNKLQLAYDEERKDCAEPESILNFHGAVTRLMRGQSQGVVQSRTRALNELCKTYSKAPEAWNWSRQIEG